MTTRSFILIIFLPVQLHPLVIYLFVYVNCAPFDLLQEVKFLERRPLCYAQLKFM